MSGNKKYGFVFVFLILLAVLYLFWPLSSSQFRIEFDQEALLRKKDFLSRPVEDPYRDRPNILLIMADDLGMADVSTYGFGTIETPNIDKLARSGITFEQAYVTSPVCSPSRAAILSGQYPQRYGFEFQMHDRYLRNRLEYYGFRYFIDSYPWRPKPMSRVPDEAAIRRQGLPPTVITLPEILKKYGYITGITGKWHLGWSEGQKPTEMGFDHQYGFYASHSLYAPKGSEGIVDQKIKGDWTDKYIWSGQRKGPHAIHRNGIPIEENGYLTDRIADEAINFISDHQDTSFFLYVSFNAPHTPLQAQERYVKQYAHIDDPVRSVYYAMISNLDDAIGRVMAQLEASGLEERTLVFFLSDNGGAEYTQTTDNGPLKGGKITDLEGGLRVPFFIRWKKNLPAGQRFNPPVSALDVFATILSQVGAEMPAWQQPDGLDLIPFVLNPLSVAPHPFLYWQRGFSKAVRTPEWKLLINEDAGDTVLFYLTKDPFEVRDVSGDHALKVMELSKAFQQWSDDLAKPLWPSMIHYLYRDGEKEYYFDQ